MKNGKLKLAIFVLVAAAAGIIFGSFATNTNADIDQLSFRDVVVSRQAGEVAGAYEVQGFIDLSINDGQTVKQLSIAADDVKTVLDLLSKAKNEGKLTLTTDKQSFGVLVNEVNGIKGGTDSKYWMYYVNGITPTVGVDAYQLKTGDKVELKFEKF